MKTTFTFLSGIALLAIVVCFSACGSDNDNPPPPKKNPYIKTVFEYRPAPGQFVNKLPLFEIGNTEEDMRNKAESAIANNKREMISLGGFGGYVVFGFDHMVENKDGFCDFRVLGNAFWATGSSTGGSSEPGVIMVSYDKNGNGKPDDEWYEIAGSEYNKSIKNYQITYDRPDPNKDPVEDENIEPNAEDVEHVYWKDNQNGEGYIFKLGPWIQNYNDNYYPKWINQDEITFTGTKVPDNGVNKGGSGGNDQSWVLTAYEYGYADNIPNNDDRSAIDINWAVDKNGNSVTLPGIHFVKVYTGMNQQCGWLGGTSTEVTGAVDLHVEYELGYSDKEIISKY